MELLQIRPGVKADEVAEPFGGHGGHILPYLVVYRAGNPASDLCQCRRIQVFGPCIDPCPDIFGGGGGVLIFIYLLTDNAQEPAVCPSHREGLAI